jgi:cell division protein FtsB
MGIPLNERINQFQADTNKVFFFCKYRVCPIILTIALCTGIDLKGCKKKENKMMKIRKAMFMASYLLLAAGVLYVSPVGAQDAQRIERLERMIKEQQRQLESMQRQLNQMKQTAADTQTQAEDAKSIDEEAKTQAKGFQPPAPQAVTSGQKRVKLAISGQVNRALNLIDDGKNTDL